MKRTNKVLLSDSTYGKVVSSKYKKVQTSLPFIAPLMSLLDVTGVEDWD